MLGRKRLTLQIDIGAQVDDLSDRPAQNDADNAAENTHGAGFGKEKFLYVAIARADGFHNSNLATALEDGHHQRVHDSDRSDGEGEATEDTQEHVEHGEKLLQAAGRIEDGESIESHLLDCRLRHLLSGWDFLLVR